jgi:3-hydroxyacyl-[acyl-carrier-protein] dehydratase
MPALLLDHFYTIDQLQQTDNVITAQISFDINHPIFKGHFPDMPIVPGVCQTQMLGEVLSKALGKEVQLKSAASIKFLSVVEPTKNKQLNLTITYTQPEADSYSVSAQYGWEQTIFFKFKGTYTC